jgi:predicted nucleic acid-binding protein
LSPRKKSRRRSRGVVDTSVLLAGIAGFRNVGHNASASLLKRWISDNTFIWLISEQILDEQKEILARHSVRRPTSSAFELLAAQCKKDEARRYHEQFDFAASPTDPLHLFVLLKDIRRHVGA